MSPSSRRTPTRKRPAPRPRKPQKPAAAASRAAKPKRAKAKAAEGRPQPAQEAMRTLEDLDQIRVLADPLRLRIVEQFCLGEFTTKQVAQKLGEKPTKLYHHVDALERVGLIRLSRTRQNRGTLEKYYIAVARAFRAESSVFNAPGAQQDQAVESVVSTIFQRTAEEMRELAAVRDSLREQGEEAIVSFIEVRTTPVELEKLSRRIKKLLGDLQAEAEVELPKGARRHRLTLAFYPLDRSGGTE